MLSAVVTLIVAATLGRIAFAGTFYVDEFGAGGNGSSWELVFTNLQDALSSVGNDNEIWVAEGTYYPTNGNDRLAEPAGE